MKIIYFFALINNKFYTGYKRKIDHLCQKLRDNKYSAYSKIFTDTSFIGLIKFQKKILFCNAKIIIVRAIGERSFLLIPTFFLIHFFTRKKILLEIPSPLSKLKFEKKNQSQKDKIYINLNNFFLRLIISLSSKVIIYDYEEKNIIRSSKKFILFSNSVNSNDYQFKNTKKQINNKFNLIFIGYLSNWHGIEKIIVSIHNYLENNNNKIKIYFDIYGDTENEYTKKISLLIKDLKLSSYINIHKPIFNLKEINLKLKNSHMGIGSLALDKSKSYYRSELKIREYCAAGVPFVYRANDIDFKNFQFCINLKSETLNILDMINWYNSLPNNTPEIMHKFSIEYLDYNIKVKKLIRDLQI